MKKKKKINFNWTHAKNLKNKISYINKKYKYIFCSCMYVCFTHIQRQNLKNSNILKAELYGNREKETERYNKYV